MNRKTKTVTEEPVAMYITDAGALSTFKGAPSFWSSLRDNRYFPLLDLISIKTTEEIRFTTGENISSDIRTYNEHTSSQRPSKNILNTARLNITSNDLFVGGIVICLNFTRYNVTIVSNSGMPKMYRPLENEKFSEYEGELVFFTIHTLNSPNSFRAVHGVHDYLQEIKKLRTGGSTQKEAEFNTLLDFVINNLQNDRNVTNGVMSDTIKVVTKYSIREEELIYQDKRSDVYLPCKGLLLSLNNSVEVSPHPLFKDAITNDKDVLEAIKAHGVACFIIDNEDLIGDRYFNFAGQVIKIPKIKSRDKLNGLYIGSIDGSKSFNTENLTDLDKIDQNKYVYKSAEEALDGADLKAKFMEESEMRKIIRAEEAQNSKLEFEARHRKLEEESRARVIEIEEAARRRVNELEEESRKGKLQHEDELRKLTIQLERLKTDGNVQKHTLETESLYRKNQYEMGKYDRDSVIETIKTVGAVAGLALGVFALYSKFSSR